MWEYKNLVTNIPPAQILLLLTHQRGKGKHQLRLQEVFSSLPWFGHCQMIVSPLLWGHSSAEAAEGTWGGGAKDLDRNNLINAVPCVQGTNWDPSEVSLQMHCFSLPKLSPSCITQSFPSRGGLGSILFSHCQQVFLRKAGLERARVWN